MVFSESISQCKNNMSIKKGMLSYIFSYASIKTQLNYRQVVLKHSLVSVDQEYMVDSIQVFAKYQQIGPQTSVRYGQ